MKFGLFVSLILHGGIIAWALITLQSTKPPEITQPKPIVVDIAKIDELTRAKKGAPKQKPKKKVEIKKPPVKAKPKPVEKPKPQKTAALPPPKAEPPKPDPIKEILKKPPPEKPKPAKKPAPEKKPVVKKKPKPKPKPKKVVKKTRAKTNARKKNDFDTENIAALLNKIPDARPGPKPKKVVKKSKPVKVETDLGAPDGAHKKLTISEYDFFIRQIGNCFAIPAGAKDAEDFRPVLSFSLRRDGTVDGIPRVVNNVNSPFFRIAAESSIRAILECQPYALPKEKYNDWKKNKITFDLKAMIGG
ncbi:MAG: hypothetical protein ACR2O4_12935 [Hyphomicrobiaceae bacterium]